MKKSVLLIILLCTIIFELKAQIVRIDTLKAPDLSAWKNNSYQRNRSYNYSVAVKVLGIEQFPKILNQVNTDNFIKTPFSGLIFKINDNQISYRFSGNFYRKDYSFKNNCAECEIAAGKLTDFSLKMGFEKAISYSTIQPYYGFDLGYRRTKFTGDVTNASSVGTTTPYDVNTSKNGAMLTPLIGVKFNLVDHLTIGFEGSMDILYDYERQDKTTQDVNRTRSLNKTTNWEFLLKPLSMLSVQYNFGLLD
ncbi:hypothetical protein [Rubrolithibacter danxiaensis]|uniref:hypothetical protein n=1 Tax=Rubrolithibacter danxiaensis TaxID=3390805 RepID=UPI003BF7E80E